MAYRVCTARRTPHFVSNRVRYGCIGWMLAVAAQSGNYRWQLALATAAGSRHREPVFCLKGGHGVPRDDWYKKDVVLRWERSSLSFAVAQELFSSHAVDAGSKLLLRSVERTEFPERGVALDFGCGYGVLGLAWKARMPDWNVRLIDRDALAVAFSAWNTERLGFAAQGGVSSSVGLGPGQLPPDGFNLVLWNVPGKAGGAVLERLAEDIADALGQSGMAALVVVNPLAAALRAVYVARADLAMAHDERFSDHTVIHVRRDIPTISPEDQPGPFDRGVFDRDQRAFDTVAGTYTIRPVAGLPEYDSLAFDTAVIVSAIDALTHRPEAVLIAGCGQGHVPIAIHLIHGVTSFTLVDRDLLAQKASARALGDVGVDETRVRLVPGVEIGPIKSETQPFDTAILRLDDQLPSAVMRTMIQDLEHLAMDDGLTVIVGGGSTSVSRWIAAVAKRKEWNARSRLKKRGASAATLIVHGVSGGRP